MNIFIVGFGSIGQRHLHIFRSLLPRAKITVVRQHSKVSSETPLPEGADCITNNFDSIIEEKPDAVIISGPASTRLKSLQPIVEAGLNVFVEKPIALDTKGLTELLCISNANKSIVYVGYVLRHLPVLIKLKEILNQNYLGSIFNIHVHVGQHISDWRPGRDFKESVSASAELGGGAIFELSHELHYIRWLFGTPKTVYCRSAQMGDMGINVEDTTNMILEYDSGLSASVHLDFLQRPASRYCSIFGEKGILEADLIAGTLKFKDGWSTASVPLEIENLPDRNSLYTRQATNFLASINGLETPLVNGQDGLAVLNIILAAKSSAESNIPKQIIKNANE